MARVLASTASVAAVLLLAHAACVVTPDASPFASDSGSPSAASLFDDAPRDDAPAALVAFVTSVEWTGNLGGIEGADEICQFEAEGAQLPGTFRAWISTASVDAIDRITVDGPWEDVLGQRLFNNHSHLRTAPLAAIEVDPFGARRYSDDVWTGTAPGGRFAGRTCLDWTSEDWTTVGGSGTTASAGARWTDDGAYACNLDAALYCFQID